SRQLRTVTVILAGSCGKVDAQNGRSTSTALFTSGKPESATLAESRVFPATAPAIFAGSTFQVILAVPARLKPKVCSPFTGAEGTAGVNLRPETSPSMTSCPL